MTNARKKVTTPKPENASIETPLPAVPASVDGFRFSMSGPNTQLEEVAVPFFVELEGALTPKGFTEDIENLNLPPEVQLAYRSRRGEMMAHGELVGICIGFALFMGNALTAWAAKKFYDEVYTTSIQPAIHNLAKNFLSHNDHKSRKKRYITPLTVSFSMFYQVERIQLTVIAHCSNSVEIEQSEALIPIAQQLLL